jgi:hypothetical protein
MDVKYKAWNIREKIWIECFYPLFDGTDDPNVYHLTGCQGDHDEDLHVPDDVIFVCSTGRILNGADVFVGDIVIKKGHAIPCEVYFDDISLSYRLAPRGDRQYDKTYPLMFGDKIIGNVFENEKLLKADFIIG